MSGNTFGSLFRITTFGESHGEAVGVIIDGCPAGLTIDVALVQKDLDRRRPGQSKITTQRMESDQVRFVSGIFEGITTGAPIAAWIGNEDQRSKDYAHLATQFRPSHADYTYQLKYGHRDHRGGGRSSARETAARVIAGSVAKQLLAEFGIEIKAYVSQVGSITLPAHTAIDFSLIESNIIRCPDPSTALKMIALIEEVKSKGDTVGGVISAQITGCPVGLGEPVFDKLHADLGKAMLSINAVKGFEVGSGFSGVEERGSTHNDVFEEVDGNIRTRTNFSGGIQGGISNGMPIEFRVAFKPVATLMQNQDSINRACEKVVVEGKGRHDPCVVPRAVPIVEAMAALTLADHFLRNRSARLHE
ncbi:MAG: chorismate synthase [Bdellovibrionales bacterium]|nr:chorismate synthase [Oligoflexia bacterium]